MTLAARRSLALPLAGALLFCASQARAQAPAVPPAADKRACADAFETAQLLKSVGKLDEAIAQAAICGAASCPKTTAVPCAAWQTEWGALLAEVSLEVVDETGATTQAASLVVDAKPPLATVPPSLRLSPGPHAFRFSRPGQPDQTASVVLGERQRETVRVAFPKAADPQAAVIPVVPPPREAPPPRVPTISWVLGGVGIAGLGAFTGFAIAGRSAQSDLEKTCSPRCSPDEASSAKTKYLIADVGLGVGLVSLAAATYFVLRPPGNAASKAARRAPTFALVPSTNGAGATLSGRF